MKLALVGDFPSWLGARIAAALPDWTQTERAVDPALLAGGPSPARYSAVGGSLQRYHLVLTHGDQGLDAVIARRMFGRNLPPVVHHETNTMTEGSARRRIERRLLRRLALPAASAVVVSDDALSATASKEWRAAAVSLPRGVAIPPPGQKPPRIPGFERKRFDFIVGIDSGDTGALRLFDLAMQIPNARVIAVGGQWESLARHARTGRDAHRLIAPGSSVSAADALAQCDLFALDDVQVDPLPAMAAGLPVVAQAAHASALSAENRERVAGIAGWAPLGELMLKLAGYGDQRRALGEANRRLVEAEHDEAKLVERYRAVLHRAMGHGRSTV